jgi:1-deoxy-D-xylulose-5-phosphate reductoisomerase
MMRRLSILGATGSIGASTLDLVRRNRDAFRVVALTGHSNVAVLAALAREFDAELAVIADEAMLPELRSALAGSGIASAGGEAALMVTAHAAAPLAPTAPPAPPVAPPPVSAKPAAARRRSATGSSN